MPQCYDAHGSWLPALLLVVLGARAGTRVHCVTEELPFASENLPS